MELPHTKQRQKYIESIKALEDEIKRITNVDNVYDLALHSVQEQLDAMAQKYQNDEMIGSARYKLYELQAFIYYFEHRDDEALDFINQAIEMKGGIYPKAEKLIDNILSTPVEGPPKEIDESNMTKAEKRKNLIGAEGWLALFVVGLFLSTALTAYNFFYGGVGASSSDVQSLNDYQSGLGDSWQVLMAFENIGLLIYIGLLIASIVLILQRKKIAKPVIITALIYSVLYNSLDYAAASSLFGSTDLIKYMQSDLSKSAGYIARGILAAIIWIPYFLVSKRVKATLTK